MAATIEEYLDLLESLDIEKVRQVAKKGVPEEVRGDVWKCLLGISIEIGDSIELLDYRDIFQTNSPELRSLRNELTRYKRRVPELDMETLQFITSNYLINHSDVQASLLVCIAGPVVYAIKDEVEAYLTLERVMRTFGIFQYSWIEDYFVQYSISHRVSQFMSLFRRKIPDLFSYFEDEEVKANDWAANWLQSFLSKELPLPIVVGIWDLYFSEGLDLHYYICLSILKLCKESLEELEQSEIISYLAKLPHFDPDELINSALNMKDDDLE